MKTTHETKEVKIDALITENLQIRVEMQEECVEEYAATFRDRPEDMPPVTVYHDRTNGKFYLADGFHRVIAARRAECDTIKANVHEGTFDDALRFALSANAKHGLRRTNADKRNAMEIAWQNRDKLFGQGFPDVRHFADICGVSTFPAHIFLKSKRLLLNNKTHVNDDIGITHGTTPDATTVTREHLEERNENVRKLLKEHKDRYGMDIPEKLMPAFLSTEPKAVMRKLGEIRELLEEKRLAGDLAFMHNVMYALRDLDAAIRALRNGAAHCVCRMCRGRGCGACNDLGFQTRLQYDRVPAEYKAENA